MSSRALQPGRVFWYDTEFFEADDGRLVLLSIALVASSGEELLLVNDSADWSTGGAIERSRNGAWLLENVWPAIQGKPVSNKNQIRSALVEFLRPRDNEAAPSLWADYAAYDHVVLAQALGTMQDYPSWLPMWTHDIQQLKEPLHSALTERECTAVERQIKHFAGLLPGKEHDAMYDAHECRIKHQWYTSAINGCIVDHTLRRV